VCATRLPRSDGRFPNAGGAALSRWRGVRSGELLNMARSCHVSLMTCARAGRMGRGFLRGKKRDGSG